MLVGSDGCDSIVFITTDLLPSDTTNLTQFTCNPDDVGMSQILLENQNGCDSLLLINTVFDAMAIDSTFIQAFTCDEDMVGTIENMLVGSDGCDSLVITTTTLDSTPEASISSAGDLDCNNASILLTGSDLAMTDNPNFEWTNSAGAVISNAETVTVSNPDTYTLTIIASNSGCTATAAIEIMADFTLPVASAGEAAVLDCGGMPIVLDAADSQPMGDLTFEWTNQDGNILNPNGENTVMVSEAGTYLLTVFDNQNGCSDSDEVSVLPFETIEANADDFTGEINTPVMGDLLTNDNINGQNIMAMVENPPSSGTLLLNEDGSFTYTPEIDFVGTITFDYAICIINCPDVCDIATVSMQISGEAFMIPDAFSPNADGKNDTWVIPTIEQYPANSMRVVNRWGDILFEARPYANEWAGTNKDGQDLPAGTYYYVLILDLTTEESYKGTVTIVR